MKYSWTLYDDEVGEIYNFRGGYKSRASVLAGVRAYIKKELDAGRLCPDTDKALDISLEDEVIERYEGTAVEYYINLPDSSWDRKYLE